MEVFRAEKIGEMESSSTRRCQICGKTLKLLRVVHYPEGKATIRVFECECGQRTWDE